jgi:hydroxyacylglutathione hydrolase
VTAWPEDLGANVWRYQTPLWQTNSLLALADGEALLCDPAYTVDEIEAMRARAAHAGGRLHLLVTHADYDHVCAIGLVPSATVVAGRGTADAIEGGVAAAGLSAAAAEWGIPWPAELRVDRVVGPGSLELGAFSVEAIDAPSHGREGLAFVLLDQGVLFPGDHLSAITVPLLAGSLERTIAANERLLDAIARHELRWVVPGHGPALTPQEARQIGQADLAYLRALQAAAAEAHAEGLSPGWGLLHVYAVEPPRPDTDDFAVYGIRAGNARLALGEERAGRGA